MTTELSQPASLGLSSTKQVWSTPELVGIICANVDQPSLGRLGRVNKAISDVSLAILYHTVSTNFYDLIKILSPTEVTENRGLIFTKPIEETDWARFLRYTKFVRSLTLANVDSAAEIFCVMDATRPPEPIFPSLQSFSCDDIGTTNYLTNLTLHNRLSQLAIKGWKPPVRLLQNIRSLASSLQSLMLTDTSMRLDLSTHAELIQLLPAFSSLIHIELPPTFMTAKVFDLLAGKQHLETIRMSKLERWEVGPKQRYFPDFVYGFRFPEGSFPALKILSIRDPSSHPQRRISIRSGFKSLQTLYLNLSGEPSYSNVQTYFQALTHGFTALTQLVIDASAKHDTYDSEATFSMLAPLLCLSQLNTFSFANSSPVSLADRHIDQITRAWPLLTYFAFDLRLFKESGHTELTLSSLIPFMQNCKFLRVLRIRLDTSIKPPLELTDELVFPKDFELLDLLNSTPGEVNDVAGYIADSLSDKANFCCGGDEKEIGRDRMDKWRAISDLVDIIRKAKGRALRRA
ncbi:hypothetical protein SISSUDRAFT_1061772 [Sistotremastrum suecicum HHB10207 ss-3]|uniref:F-box domain-containing protein n=1 Tax=Sistotremastrum suecicum HHB10207 ss-3 TaxID=1314776 RepID=A0A166DNV6_9AGAM|nr:hypothetical protein SISSUDRAFT_1061772 [Sistotremastrum suecicum HHB10207 ss-3]